MTIINLQLIVGLACSIHIILIHLQRKKLQRKLLIFLQNRFFFVRRNNLSLYISFEQLAMFAPWQSHKSLRNYKLGSINGSWLVYDDLTDVISYLPSSPITVGT